MDKKISLLLDPPHILPPGLVLTQNNTPPRNESESQFKCEKCKKSLDSSYYILIGIPPSPLLVDFFFCKNIDDEKIKEKTVLSGIQTHIKDFDIESLNQWIFSEDNIISSKIRICTDCYGEYGWPGEWHKELERWYRIRQVHFAVEEYQRRHTPIDSCTSEYDNYRISLPDRSEVHYVGFGDPYGIAADIESNFAAASWFLGDVITLVLIPDLEPSDLESLFIADSKALLQKIRAEFIHNKDRIIPTEQDLSACLKKYCNDEDFCNIESCKIFINPGTYHSEDRVYERRHSVFVNCVNGDWYEFNTYKCISNKSQEHIPSNPTTECV
jgi:hypothetical protein